MKKLAYFLILLSFLFSSCKSKKTLVVSPAYPVLAVDSLCPDTGGFISGLFAPDHSQLKELQRTQKQKKKQQVKSASHNSPVPVSYTHLDVYKRQGTGCKNGKISSRKKFLIKSR